MLWDLYQQIRIHQLDARIDSVQSAPAIDGQARDSLGRMEEKLDRLALITRAMFELMQAGGVSEAQLSAKVTEIDLRDGQADGRMLPTPRRCPRCDAMISPKFGCCLFCGHRDEAAGSFA